ncbi:TBC1 domain protein, putative [Trichomonas vaginalis G3]|uniref:TBC1 domain protein, putative n=1 Tax=Trichomonas vaginalis (strain ATCC PRA-98 / G3) TaxID=412133 RepID=A2F037_TRIV3|nr:regulation of vesicle fusion [Trichomonas vaginalis G3]EAY01739.1 TBC1 domain protein, putative [Trichomonas vaginalis G3]KAI5532804.1 regulation of vesicle fusion [Trichomonas vaginalis G3]|eukprot:XP_001314297.1 TBC1 domain protein [Trichomonas vaginalis G3]
MESHQFEIFKLIQPSDQPVDVEKIRELTRFGIQNAMPEDRCSAWLVYLQIYPENGSEWNDTKQKNLEVYNMYKEMQGLNEYHTKPIRQHFKKEDFQLKNNDLMNLIHGDIVRTGRHIMHLPESRLPGVEYEPLLQGEVNILKWEGHMRRMERILYILGSINPALSYMQGFNELLMPIYNTVYNAQAMFNNNLDEVECICFFMLHNLISRSMITDLFTTQDKSSIIIHRLKEFDTILQKHVEIAHRIINKHQIHPVCYCFRWFSLLFCQDYDLKDVLLIWDALLTNFDIIVKYSFYVGAAQISLIKDNLDENDYAATIHNLQNLPQLDVHEVLKIAANFWQIDNDKTITGQLLNAEEFIKNKFDITAKKFKNFFNKN